jgi:hypothetical protein
MHRLPTSVYALKMLDDVAILQKLKRKTIIAAMLLISKLKHLLFSFSSSLLVMLDMQQVKTGASKPVYDGKKLI